MSEEISIDRLKPEDILPVVKLHRECFPTDTANEEEAKQWIECNSKAYPRSVYYVAKKDGEAIGYIMWMEKGGFRKEAVLDLEQVGVAESCRLKGVGTRLVQESLKQYVENILKPGNRRLKLCTVTTGTDNQAQKLYRKSIGAEPACTIPDLFEGDELMMMARKEQLEEKLQLNL